MPKRPLRLGGGDGEHDPRAVANEFLKLNNGQMNQMKLQKLVYLSHGWNLAINGAPLVAGRIEAWDGGPVMRLIWNHIRDFGYNTQDELFGESKNKPFKAILSANERSVVEHVWRKYSVFDGLQLSEMTHRPGTPWTNAYFGRGRNHALSDEDIIPTALRSDSGIFFCRIS